MRLIFAVCFLLITYVVSYPAFNENAADNNDNDLQLELRSILKHLNEEQMTRSLTSDEDDDDEYEFSKRQGGNNVIDKQSDCEIKCIYTQRFPASGKGKSVKEAANACKNLCPATKKRANKKTNVQKKAQPNKKLNTREFIDDDDSNSSEDEQQAERRELYNYLMEQLQQK